MNKTATIFMCVCGLLAAMPARANKHVPRPTDIIAVEVRAADCRSCEKLSPAFEKIKEKYKRASMTVVDFDFSDQEARQRARQAAESHGIAKIYQEFPEKGYVLLIDKNSKQVVGRLDPEQSFEEMSFIVDSVLSGVPMAPQGYFIPDEGRAGERRVDDTGAPGAGR